MGDIRELKSTNEDSNDDIAYERPQYIYQGQYDLTIIHLLFEAPIAKILIQLEHTAPRSAWSAPAEREIW